MSGSDSIENLAPEVAGEDAKGEAGSAPEIATTDLSEDSLYSSNMAMFKEKFPDVYRMLVAHNPISKLQETEDGDYNVFFRNEPMFAAGAKAEAAKQLENITAHTSRLQMSVSADGLDNQAGPAFSRVLDRAAKSGITFADAPTRTEAYYLIVLGIGLGFHLEDLVERTSCRTLTLIEPNVDFLYHSCFTLDWCQLVQRMEERGRIDFFLGADAEFTAMRLHTIFRRDNPANFDGAVVFRHYRTSITQGIERKTSESIRTAVMGLGFFQDEVNMLAQTYKNLEGGNARITKLLRASPGMPVFVIGNGPSLQGLLPFIKKHIDNVILISCGSSLEILLKNGISPDIWVMMERHDSVFRLTRETSEKFDISKIVFIGSTTVFPGLPDLFDETLFFYRSGLSPTPLFCTDKDQMPLLCDPMAANAGLAVAMHLGFRETYLLGVDVGSRVQDSGHTKGGWYDRIEDHIKTLQLPLRGNFGGEIWTMPQLQWSKENIERLIKVSRGRKFYNVSDGALIEGATPLHPKAAKIGKSKKTKSMVMKEVVEGCPQYDKPTFDMRWENSAVIDNLHEIKEKIISTSENMKDFEFEKELSQILEPNSSRDPVAMILRGTLYTFLIAYNYYSNRIVDAAERDVFEDIVREEFVSLTEHLCARATEIFMGLEAGEPWEETFVE